MRSIQLFVLFILLSICSIAQKGSTTSFEKWISLQQSGNAKISPDGQYILYAVSGADWVNNTNDTEFWLSEKGGKPFQLTNTAKGSSSAAAFTPDSKWISFMADRGNKSQLYLISVKGGEAQLITNEEGGIQDYSWSPDGKKIALKKADEETKAEKSNKEKYGAFGVEGLEYKLNHLWILDYNQDSIQMATWVPGKKMPVSKRLTEGGFTVNKFAWRPDGKSIGMTVQPDPFINSSMHADVAMVDLATKKTEILVKELSGDFFEGWSPDGKKLLYTSHGSDTVTNYYKNDRFYIHDLNARNSVPILENLDAAKYTVSWNPKGLYVGAMQKMKGAIFQVDASTGKYSQLATGLDLTLDASFSTDGKQMAITGRNFDQLNEVWWGPTGSPLTKISTSTAQLAGWKLPKSDIISWSSEDGTIIEGVLIKPADFDATKKYPLLVMIHGGPTGIDRPEPAPGYVYPVVQWIEKGALVLRVNYRGSEGYGEKFRTLNVRNLGVGDMWDVMSGVEFLSKKGFIDTSRMGCMGWSQGGYISAFLSTNTNRFKAISVGAGISNWVTYYVSTDITNFTRQYLLATPWADMEVYRKTSPMTNINQASTPTLIQHGEFDKRVPIPNAYELYRGLQDRNIPSKLIVYKGFGHGINKPKERLAAIWHNWLWFNQYVFGETGELMPVE